MSNNIQGLSDIYSVLQLNNSNNSKNTSTTSLGNLSSLSNCSCDSSSDSLGSSAFNIMITSLLSAISEKNKTVASDEEKLSLEDIFNTYNSALSNTDSTNNYITSNIENLNSDVRIENAIQVYSDKYNVDPNLVKSIIKVESDFDPSVVSSAGAKGLMQLMPENCEDLGVSDPFNIEQNIEGGVRHIKEYLDRYNGDVEMALMAYNGGPTRMMNRGVKSIDDIYKMPKETQNYVPKVMSYYRGLTNGN